MKTTTLLLFVITLKYSCVATYGQFTNVNDGIEFGSDSSDPRILKNVDDVEVEAPGGAVTFFNGENSAKFRAGEGHSNSVLPEGWYRIAKSSGNWAKRASAAFSLRSTTSGNHSAMHFRAGIHYNYEGAMSFTLLEHSYFFKPTFTKVRILEKSGSIWSPDNNYEQYLDVYVDELFYSNQTHQNTSFVIYDNLSASGWTPVNWEAAGQVPSGYAEHVYDVNKVFVAGDSKSRLSVGRGGAIDLEGTLTLLGDTTLDGTLTVTGDVDFGEGLILDSGTFSSTLTVGNLATGTANGVSLGDESLASGLWSLASGDGSIAAGVASHAFGINATTDAVAQGAIAMGTNVSAGGTNSVAIGNNLQTTATGSIALGQFNILAPTEWSLNDELLVVGNGEDENSRSNALTILKDGTIIIEAQGDIPMFGN